MLACTGTCPIAGGITACASTQEISTRGCQKAEGSAAHQHHTGCRREAERPASSMRSSAIRPKIRKRRSLIVPLPPVPNRPAAPFGCGTGRTSPSPGRSQAPRRFPIALGHTSTAGERSAGAPAANAAKRRRSNLRSPGPPDTAQDCGTWERSRPVHPTELPCRHRHAFELWSTSSGPETDSEQSAPARASGLRGGRVEWRSRYADAGWPHHHRCIHCRFLCGQ